MTVTVDDMEGVARTWLGEDPKVISHGAPRDIELELIQDDEGGQDSRGKARALARWLEKSGAQKVLVFENSRIPASTCSFSGALSSSMVIPARAG